VNQLFWGFFFIFVNFNLNINTHTLNILPPFVGYLFLLQGMRSLETESGLFQTPRPFAVAMAVYTGLVWLGDLLGIVSNGSWLETILGGISAAVSLYVSWSVIQGVRDIEKCRGTELNGAAMQRAWAVLAVAELTCYAMLFLVPAMAVVGAVASLVGIIMMLVAFWRGKKLYERIPPLSAPGPEL